MQRVCASCGRSYEAKRPNSKFCGDTCRKRAQRSPGKSSAPVNPSLPELLVGLGSDLARTSWPLTDAVERELDGAGRLDSVFGQAALVLARRLESPMETGASIASMTRQLRETMGDALKGAAQAADPLDEIRRRRELKRGVG
jgi:hypothetical protein